jgi:hypothetical protein
MRLSDMQTRMPPTRTKLLVAAAAALVSCCACATPTGPECATSVSALRWSIWVTPTLGATELKVGEELGLGLLPLKTANLCRMPSYDEVWSQSNPPVANLIPFSSGHGATLRGLETGTTVVTAEVVGADGARGKATQVFRVVP